MAKNFKFNLNGMTFTLPTKFLRKTDWNGKPLEKWSIEISPVSAGKVIKQYVKKKYPNVVCSVTSESFSGGNSLRVYLSNNLGESVDDSIYKDVDRFGTQFQSGNFNGMIDMYEYRQDKVYTDNGTNIDYYVKYFFVENSPKFCSLPSVVKMLREMTTFNEDGNPHYTFGVLSVDYAVKKIKSYGASERNIQKALDLHTNLN